ncbi:MAG: isocitrate lyase/PEP mutase family protein, partial [Bryobacteraceae bacterium]
MATTSGGIANAAGYADGEYIPRDEMLKVVERIARLVDVPVTADLEAGYGETVEAAAETARGAIAAGAVGLNLEDAGEERGTLIDMALQSERIAAVRSSGESLGVPLAINARTDVYLASVGDPARRFESAVERAIAYFRAGAVCVFVPGVRDAETIGRLARALPGPLNVLAGPGMPPTGELQRLGVARVSVGSGPMRATMGLVQRIARELREQGTFSAMIDGAMPYAEANT